MKRPGWLLLLLLLTRNLTMAQTPEARFTFDHILDNREYFSDYAWPQTIFGVRLDAQAVFRLDSVHSVGGGLNYMYEFGGAIRDVPLTVDLYYHMDLPNLSLYLGSFPRKGVVEHPLFMLTDTLDYYRPNVEGASVTLKGEWGRFQGWIDWTGRESQVQREQFLAGIDSRINRGIFFLEPSLVMYHNARSLDPGDTEPLQDNGAVSLLGGADLASLARWKELWLATGYAASYNRFRPDPVLWSDGWMIRGAATYTIFALRGVYYNGDPLHVEYGEPFYRSGNYGRIGLFVDPFPNPAFRARLGWNLHMVGGEGVHHSQQLLLTIKF